MLARSSHPRRAGARPGALVCALVRATALACALAVVAAAPVPAAAAAPAGPGAWSPPVDGPVVRAFDPPASRYGAGHLGVDYGCPPGTVVRAAGDGVVSFAGPVAGGLHVVVAHAGGLRTSYSFLASVAVRRGDAVARGQTVGRSGGPGHPPGVVHFGLRSGDRYLDPLALFRPPDLARAVHLVPAQPFPALASAAAERAALAIGLDGGGPAGAFGRLLGAGARAAGRLAGMAAGAPAPFADLLAAAGRRAPGRARWIASLGPLPFTPFDLLDAGRSLLAWARSRRDCDPHAPPADGTGGSAHRALVVAGINSATGAGGRTNALPVERLGYAPGEVRWYSYAPGGGAYDREDTYVPIEVAARRLGEQLRAMQRDEPGREVDLLAHSQGGVVVHAFLALVYDAADPSYPPLGTVVTLAAPHRGAAAASSIRFVATSDAGRAFLDALPDGLVPPPGAAPVRDLAEDSRLLDRLDRARLPDQVDLTTIGAALDAVVPEPSTRVGGAAHALVNPWTPRAHHAVLTDPDALRAVRSALEGGALPCVSFGDALAGAVAPVVITRLERWAGLAGRAAGGAVDAAAP